MNRRLLFACIVLTVVSVALGVFAGMNRQAEAGDRATEPYPAAWSELEPGQATKADIRRVFGAGPNEVKRGMQPGEECWYYELQAPTTNYRFCFEGETMSYKSHY